MPFRSSKMYSFIFGFQRFVWWPKCTPASRRSFIAIPGNSSSFSLAFAELEALARASHSVFLAFLDARVRCQQPVLLQLLAELRVVLDESPRDRQPHGARLPVDTAAGDRREDIELLPRLREEQGPADLRPQRVGREVLIEFPVVDGDGALAGAEENASGRRLAATGCVIFDACQLCDLDACRLLGGMRMIGTRVDLEFSVHRLTHLGFRQHAANRFFHETNRLTLADDAGALFPQSTFVSTVVPIDFLVFLATGQLDLRRIHDDDVIARIDERGVGRLMLALEQPRGERRHPPEHLAPGVDDMPPAVRAFRARYKRTHEKGILRGFETDTNPVTGRVRSLRWPPATANPNDT